MPCFPVDLLYERMAAEAAVVTAAAVDVAAVVVAAVKMIGKVGRSV